METKREIKFRGWNNHKKEMLFNFNDCTMGFEKDGTFNIAQYVEYGSHEDFYPLVLMQFTGLKDKNGKEIYEGDIVKIWGSIAEDDPAYGFYEPEYEVIFKNGMFVFNGDIEFIHLLNEQSEIIGNIYENSELLNYGN